MLDRPVRQATLGLAHWAKGSNIGPVGKVEVSKALETDLTWFWRCGTFGTRQW